jgi:AraC-like DNA-binding protein
MTIKDTRDARVRRATALLREQEFEPVRLRDACEAIGVSERSLRDAFYRVCGMSPMRFKRLQRLIDARRALQTAPPDRGAVTQVAIQFGFFELGRFAKSQRLRSAKRRHRRCAASTPTHWIVRHSRPGSRLPMLHSLIRERILCLISVTVVGKGGSRR